MRSSYFAPLVTLPVIIAAPGNYVTRDGQVVTIDTASSRHNFRCKGSYKNGVREGWHKSGRIFAGYETANDVVKAA
jgi:hypothetical protein